MQLSGDEYSSSFHATFGRALNKCALRTPQVMVSHEQGKQETEETQKMDRKLRAQVGSPNRRVCRAPAWRRAGPALRPDQRHANVRALQRDRRRRLVPDADAKAQAQIPEVRRRWRVAGQWLNQEN